MAKDKKVSSVKSVNLDKERQQISSLNNKTTFMVNGVTEEFKNDTEKDFENIRHTIKNIARSYKTVTGENLAEFFTRTALDQDNQNNKNALNNGNTKKDKINLEKVLENPNNGLVNEIYASEKSRISKMADYDKIVKYIPQLYQALNVLVDNIMSPDDFTKDIFTLQYNDKDVSTSDKRDKVIENLKNLEEKYCIEDKTRDIIFDTLKYGDQFISILKLDTEFDKLFGEDGKLLNLCEDMEPLSESSILLTEAEEKELISIFKENNAEFDESINIKESIANLISNNLELSLNVNSLYENELIMEADFSSPTVGFGSQNSQAYEDNMTHKSLAANGSSKRRKTLAQKINDRKSIFSNDNPLISDLENEVYKDESSEKSAKKRKGYVSGSFIKVLDPEKVIKISMGDTCYGYYYLETELDNLQLTQYNNSLAIASSFQFKAGVDINTTHGEPGNYKGVDSKTKLILDVFLKNISKRLDKRFIESNEQFKNMLYELMKKDYILRKKVRITYIPPESMVHIYVNKKEDAYGRSVFDRILFTAKIYLAVLTTTLMLKLTRSTDRRTFYIEAGLSNELEATIQGFVHDIKAKEISMSDLNNIDTILNNIGQFHDYYIPQFDGQKSVDIDTTPGQQIEMDNEFLEYLKKTMISGMGIPASFLSYADEMEFARSVSMMNGMFLRQIVSYQKSLTEGFSDIYRKLYQNEYDIEKEREQENIVIDLDLIKAVFPSPATLNMTNLQEQIGTAQSIIDFVVNTMVGTDDSSGSMEAVRTYMTKEVTKDVLPNIDWDKYEKMYNEFEHSTIEDRLKKTLKTSNNGGGDDMMNGM